MWEKESITKVEENLNEIQLKQKDISKIFNNNNNYSIFSKHLKNYLCISPIKKHQSSEKKNNQYLSADYNNINANKPSVFTIKNQGSQSPTLRKLLFNQKNPQDKTANLGKILNLKKSLKFKKINPPIMIM